jgi:hypothetical protein
MPLTNPDHRNAQLQELDHMQKLLDGKQLSGELPFATQYEALPGPGCEGDLHAPWRPSAHRDLADPALAAILRKACPCFPQEAFGWSHCADLELKG